jgi:hypothetical protein
MILLYSKVIFKFTFYYERIYFISTDKHISKSQTSHLYDTLRGLFVAWSFLMQLITKNKSIFRLKN